MSVDKYIDQLKPPMREIVEKLRSIVKSTDSRITEQIKWNVPVFSISKNICSIIVHKQYVNFQIFQGGNLKDANELEGTGKAMRHIKLYSLEDVKKGQIQKYLKQAIQLDQQQ